MKRLEVIALEGVGEVAKGDSVGNLVCDACARLGLQLSSGDIVVVAHKIVSKSEGRTIDLDTVAPSVLLVPSHDEMGTNALLLTPPDVLDLRFGYDSFTYHRKAAGAKGVEPKIIRNDRIALDIDEPQDLRRFLSVSADCETRRAILAMKVPEFALASQAQ